MTPPRPFPLVALICALAHQQAIAQSMWETVSSGTPNLLSGGVAADTGRLVLVGEDGTILTAEADVTSWSAAPSPTAAALRATAWADGWFLAVGETGTILTSPDGTSWDAQASGTTHFLSGAAAGGGRWIAVGANGTTLWSDDRIAWTRAQPVTGEFLQDVTFGQGRFLAVGGRGAILTSPDGQAWTRRPSGTTAFLTAATHFAGRFYAVGQGGTILSSPDGLSWDAESSGTLAWLRGIATDGSTLVACGEDGTILSSTDGSAWQPTTPAPEPVLLSGAFFTPLPLPGHFVLVGEPGAAGDGTIAVGGRTPGFGWGAPTYQFSEASPHATLEVFRTGDLGSPASVAFATAAGSAQPGSDFTSTSGSVDFAAGEWLREVTVPLASGPEPEPEESFTVELSSPTPASHLVFPPPSATVRLTDAQDSDSDGLSDAWEVEHFGATAAQSAAGDPDGDGNDNAREESDGTDPNDPASARYRVNTVVEAGAGSIALSPNLSSFAPGTPVSLAATADGEFVFDRWAGDTSGDANPLELVVTGDITVAARFLLPLGAALDEGCQRWESDGTAAWAGQTAVSNDGHDAAEAGGLTLGQQATLETTVYGPAEITFHWRLSAGQFDSLRFFVGGSPRAALSGDTPWREQTFLIGAGPTQLRWVYAKNSSAQGGSNQAWLDQVSLRFSFDVWQAASFNAAEQADPSLSGPLADPDGDGAVNLFEFYRGTRPKVGDPGRAGLRLAAHDDAETLEISWQRHTKRAASLGDVLERSTDLDVGQWSPVEPALTVTPLADGLEQVATTLPRDGAVAFFRLRITHP